ncbi:hypothetical protein [Crystallibacter crystallopoietes]|uniref:hypothetical protein n=1 Tax=Crystallibacter crystallopoietes TaxID=37928 RepID=UPI00123723EB|nr:hypothetical protein [Arthrobacter crystallopoietes]
MRKFLKRLVFGTQLRVRIPSSLGLEFFHHKAFSRSDLAIFRRLQKWAGTSETAGQCSMDLDDISNFGHVQAARPQIPASELCGLFEYVNLDFQLWLEWIYPAKALSSSV